jgi:O-succinylbenzoic acid--CoA ligase
MPLQSYRTHRQEQILSLWGIPYPKTLALTLAHRELANKELPEWERDFFSFLVEWWDDSPTLAVQTSGSTGTPKTIEVEKERMMQSAITTCNALALKKGDKALLCLPVKYIAGKMMVVRALVAGLDLCPVAPSGNPLASISDAAFFDFAAMIPLQIINSLQNDNAKLGNINNGIIGGASIDPKLEAEIASLPNSWYSTYGMTETLSHIALRRLNGTGKSEVYYPVPNVSVSLSDEETLVINAPSVCSEILVTKDIARIAPDGGFEILGRKDNVINSGGIKLQPEQIEQKLAQIVRRPLCITSLSDPKLGEKVVLLIESSKIEPALLLQQIASRLELYERPKLLLFTNRLPLTPNGKIDRRAARKLALLLA